MHIHILNLHVEGIQNKVKPTQPLKAKSLIKVKDEFKSNQTRFNDEHSLKAKSPIFTIDEGIDISFNYELISNA